MTLVKTRTTVLISAVLLLGCGNQAAPTKQSNTAPAGYAATSAKPVDEGRALDLITKINEAQATHFKLNRRYALTFDELVDARLLASEPAAAQTGYVFKLRPAADAQTYRISIDPEGDAGARYFFTDQTGVIHGEAGKEATADSPRI
jgi:hypothetical protein